MANQDDVWNYQYCGPFKAPFFHPRCDEYPMYCTLAGDKPQPKIFGFNKAFVYAGLEVWPPSRAAPGENMELAAIIKIQPPPHPRWVTTVCRMIAFPARENPLTDPVKIDGSRSHIIQLDYYRDGGSTLPYMPAVL